MTFDLELYAGFAEIFLEDRSLAEKDELLRRHATARPLSWSLFVYTMAYIRENVTAGEALDFGFDDVEAFTAYMDSLVQPATWSFLATPAMPTARVVPDLADLANACAASTPGGGVVCPRAFGKHRLILHAFSGRRRHGDFQEFFEAAVAKIPGVVFHVVSVDIVLSPIWGNVAKTETQQFWIRGVQQCS